MANKKNTLLGFKASEDDLKKVERLVDFFQKQVSIPDVTISNSQILRMALDELYKKHIIFEEDVVVTKTPTTKKKQKNVSE